MFLAAAKCLYGIKWVVLCVFVFGGGGGMGSSNFTTVFLQRAHTQNTHTQPGAVMRA